MNSKELAKNIVSKSLEMGADKAQVIVSKVNALELNAELNDLKLLRETNNQSLVIKLIKNNKEGTSDLSSFDESKIEDYIKETLEVADSGSEDICYDIASEKNVELNDSESKLDQKEMVEKLKGFIDKVKSEYPVCNLRDSSIKFNQGENVLVNSHGVELTESKNYYGVRASFLSKKENNITSFSYFGYTTKTLPKTLLSNNYYKDFFSDSEKSLQAKSLGKKFVGKILLTPEGMSGLFEQHYLSNLKDGRMIKGNSFFNEKLNQKVASEKLTIKSLPESNYFSGTSKIMSDGYIAKNTTILESGELKSYLLSDYGARKLDFPRCLSDGRNLVVEPGETALEDMIKGIDEGLILGYFSGGYPDESGEFSGIAKNSFYVKDGKIVHALKETMISGNLFKMFNDVTHVSKESINNGSSSLCWLLTDNMTISG